MSFQVIIGFIITAILCVNGIINGNKKHVRIIMTQKTQKSEDTLSDVMVRFIRKILTAQQNLLLMNLAIMKLHLQV